jgi:hypothetical protein
MKVVGLDGREHVWNPVGNTDVSREFSSHHLRARGLLHELFSTERVLEEVPLPGTWPMLYADFIIPIRQLLIETHGPQHYEFTPFFHNTKKDFYMGKMRDKYKRKWAEINQFIYIELPHWEDIREWRGRIINFGAPTPEQPLGENCGI